jgi:hypothetical protein
LRKGTIFDSISSYLGEITKINQNSQQKETITGQTQKKHAGASTHAHYAHKKRTCNYMHIHGRHTLLNREKHLSFDQFTVGSSILFTTTSSLDTPKVFAS